MTPGSERRKYDIVLVGATGYTGRLTAEYISRQLPSDIQWAISGRSRSKLDALAAKLKDSFPDRPQPAIEAISLADQTQLDTLIATARVCISVVAYWKDGAGEAIVKACVENRTDYLDVAGEPLLLRDWSAKYHEAAKAAGVVLIHNCGAAGAPQDLTARAAVRELRVSSSLKAKEVVMSVKDAGVGGGISTGSLESLLHTFDLDPEVRKESQNPWVLCPPEAYSQRRDKHAASSPANALGLRRNHELGLLSASSTLAVLCETMVNRTWGLLQNTDMDYGPHFRYSEYEPAHSALRGVLNVVGVLLLHLILGLAPTRALVRRFFLTPGDGSGPDVEKTRNARIALEAIAIADTTEERGDAGTRPVRARAVFSHPSGSYHFSGILLAQAAASLLYTRKLEGGYTGGCLTPAFLGDDFVRRLQEFGAVMNTETLLVSN